MSSEPTPPSRWAAHASAPATPQTLSALATTDPTTLTGAELIDAITASEKALSLLAAQQIKLMAALAKPFAAGDPMRLAARLARKNNLNPDNDDPDRTQLCVDEAATCLAASEIAAALRISPITAGIRVRDAQTMTTVLTPTLHALEQGHIDRGKSRVIADHCQPLTPEHTTQVQNLVLPTANQLSTSELRDLTGQAVITVDPAGAEERHQSAAARRDLKLRAQPDAMATLNAYLPADGAVKIFQISDLLATSTAAAPDDPRGIGARRVDALIDIAEQLLAHGYLDITDYIDTPTDDNTPAADTPGHKTDLDHDDPERSAAANSTEPNSTEPNRTPVNDADRVAPGTNTAENVDTGPDHSDPADPADPADPSPADPAPVAPGTADPVSSDIDPNDTEANKTPAGQTAVGGTESDDRRPWKTCLDNILTPNDIANLPTAPVDPPADPADPSAVDPLPADASPVAPGTAGPVDDKPRPATPPNQNRRPTAKRRPGTRRNLSRQGRRPHLSVIIGLGTLTGTDDLPAQLAGYGAIPASLGRAIATSAGTVTALLADPTNGVVTTAGTLTYRPTQHLRDQIAALTPTCQFPSCRQPVWRCDIDHREPFDHHDPDNGGRTDEDNTGPFCRRHHLLKHHTEWRFRVNPQLFLLEWISPTGHHYTKKQRPTLPTILSVTTPGAAMAERLDILTAFTNTTTRKRSEVEELLTTMLLHNKASQRHIEYVPMPSTPDRSTGSDLDQNVADYPKFNETNSDEPPPF